jgi:hypothetical protein
LIGDAPPTTSLRDAAVAYQQAGLAVLPARRAEKRPAIGAWKQYRQRPPTPAEVSGWFANAHDAVCVLCGGVSGNTEIIDFDAGGELFDAWCRRVPPELRDRLSVERTPSGGYHAVYQSESEVCGNLKLAQRRSGGGGKVVTLIETRGEGGLFLCAPTDGYEMVQGDLLSLPTLTEAERDALLQAAWELNEYVPPVVNGAKAALAAEATARPGDEFNARGDVRQVLVQHGWSHVRDGSDGNEYWRRPGKPRGWSATLKDGSGGGVFYVFSSSADPFEPNRAYSPFAVYALLEHGGNWSRAASALRTQGFGSPPGTAVGPVVGAGATAPFEQPQPLSVRELRAQYPQLRQPVIHGLLRRGETMNLISAPKMGKSWLVLDLALAVATGRDWLEQFRCERGEVLILDNELHRETSANRIPKVAEARGIPADAYADRVFVHNLRGGLKDVYTLGAFFQSVEPGRYRVIILDAFYRFMPRDMDENDNGTMASLYNHLDLYADRLGCSFVLIHHTTKGSQSAKSVTDVGAGAGSQSRATDTHVVLRSHEEDDAVVLDAAVRSWPPVSPRCLRWSFPVWYAADDLDPSQLRSEGGKKRGEKKDEWTPQAFVQAFVDGEPATRSSLIGKAVQAGLSRWAADNLLRMADADGLMHREGSGGRNSPFTYRRAATPPEQEATP